MQIGEEHGAVLHKETHSIRGCSHQTNQTHKLTKTLVEDTVNMAMTVVSSIHGKHRGQYYAADERVCHQTAQG